MKELDVSEFWARFKSALSDAGISQAELCRRCDFNEGSFKNRISKKVFPTVDDVYKIAVVLGISVDLLLGLSDIPQDVLDAAYEINALPPVLQRIVLGTLESCKEQLSARDAERASAAV